MGNPLKSLVFGVGARGVEKAFTAGWSVGEVLYALRKPDALWRDPYRSAVLTDIEEHGLYRSFPGERRSISLKKRGWIAMRNPYEYIGEHPQDKIVAQMRRPKSPRKRHVLIMCHCYGIPLPLYQQTLFKLDRLMDRYDVVYNIMNKHYWGSFGPWPGFGLASPRISETIEVMRSAITGLRTLITSLRHTYGYETVSLLGYSIGGQLSLHAANHVPLDRLALYCPVTDLGLTYRSLGVMERMGGGVEKVVGSMRSNYSAADLAVLDPLLPDRGFLISPSRVTVIAQRHDVMVPPAQVARIKARYPEVEYHELGGTHTFPDSRADLAAILERRFGGG